ncbi:ATP-binding protein [Pseudomonas sp. NPDC090208]|uniref:ATP-binding protein n=1 Tax=Pseudomonas sp. NPDC090208 TaxID=3364478 RepID=UPI00381AAA4A
MSQLIKIVLVDSLCAGAKAELAMKGNTSVTGENGIGKSSFIKLIPVFYGASPGRLVKATTNRESFANWYLPRSSSFIVFDYINHAGDARCAIMHRSGEGYAYRLVSSAWSAELLYRDYETGLLVLPGELHGHLAHQGISCSPELQPYHYRQIIQFNSGTAHLEKVADAGKRKLIVSLRPGFSLAPKRKDFNGIDFVTLALIESGGTFDTMKATMAEILQQDNADPSRTLMMLNAQPFRSVVDNRAGYLLMESLKPAIFDMNRHAHDFRAVIRQMGVHKRRALMVEEKLKERQNARTEALTLLHSEDDQLQSRSRDLMSGLNGQKGEANVLVAAEETWLQRFEEKRDGYLKNRTQELSEEFDQLGEIRDQLHLKQEHQVKLSRQGADIRSVFQELEAAARQAAADGRNGAFSKYQASLRVIQQRQQELSVTQAKLLDERRAAHEEELAAHQQEQLQATGAQARELARAEQLKSVSALPEAQIALDESQRGINEQMLVIAEFQNALNAVSAEADSLSQERQTRAAEYSGLQARRDALGEAREDLKQQINAGAETLLGFLRRHHPGWTENIARLVPAETLMRTDLNPALLEAVQESLYGVEINLDVLPQATVASTHALESEVALLTTQILEISTEIDAVERQQRAVEDRLRQTGIRASAAQKELSNACLSLETLKGDHAGLIDHAREEVVREIEIQAALIVEVAHRLDLSISQVHNLKKRHQQELGDLQAEGEKSQQQLVQDQSRADLELQTAQNRVDATLIAELERAQADMEARLKSAGIDDTAGKRLSSEIAELEKVVKRLRDHESQIDGYRLWVKESVPAVPERKAALARATAELERVTRAIEQLQLELRAAQKAIAERRKALVTQGYADDLELGAVSRVLRELDQINAASEAHLGSTLKAEDIEDEVGKLKRRRGACHREGVELYRQVHHRFVRDRLVHTPQGAAIEQIINHASNASHELELAWLEAAPSLQEYIEISHPDQKTKLIIQAKNLSDELCDNRSKLQQLHRSILKLGKDATAKASEVLSSFAQIRQFEFKVSSRIHEMSFWDDMTNYEQQYKRWSGMGSDYLPTDGFMDALRTIERQIEAGAFTSQLADCFDVSVTCNDQGRVKVATNNAELINLSSTGLTKIIVAMIYVSLFELLRNEADFQMSIPIDEALELSPENYVALVNYFNERGLSMLACFPGGAPELLRQFNNRYSLERRSDTDSIVVKEYGIEEKDELDDLNDALGSDDREDAL